MGPRGAAEAEEFGAGVGVRDQQPVTARFGGKTPVKEEAMEREERSQCFLF